MYSKCVTVPTIDTKLFPNLRFSSCCSSRNISSSICSRKRNNSSMYNKYMTVPTIDTELFPTSQLSSLLICHSITRHVVSSSPFVMFFSRRFKGHHYHHYIFSLNWMSKIFASHFPDQQNFTIHYWPLRGRQTYLLYLKCFFLLQIYQIYKINVWLLERQLSFLGQIIVSFARHDVIWAPHIPPPQHINHPPLWRHWGPSGAVVPCITNTLFRLQNKSLSHTGRWASV